MIFTTEINVILLPSFIRWRYGTSHLTVKTHTVDISFEQVMLLFLSSTEGI